MEQRVLGKNGPTVSALGLGCMGMTWAYEGRDEAEAVATIHESLDLGVTFLDTAEVYGPFTNEELLGKALKGKRDRVVIATKFGFTFTPDGKITGTDSRPEHVREVLEGSLKRLGTDHIDLLYQHRVDPNVPIEETVGAMARLVKAGKVRHLGLSEASPATLWRASAVHSIAALQSEYSLWERGVEREVLPACRELGIGFVPYSPLGRGFLTGAGKRADQYAEGDSRRNLPRFQGANYDRNVALAAAVRERAAAVGCTAAQFALAWLLHRGQDVVPIPGTKRRKYLRENVGTAAVRLSPADLGWVDRTFPVGAAAGERYSEPALRMIDR
jgi:aryl-alcohol dehydrogenase-like predicted oxidoreductase